MPQRSHILILSAAAVIISGLCAWRIANPHQRNSQTALPEMRMAAPAFQLYDQESTLVNLESFLHRHQVVLVFFDGQAGPESSRVLTQLREFHPALKREGIIVLGVSTALPQEIRNNSAQPFPFPILSDAAATDPKSVHQVWGRYIAPESLDKPAGTIPGVFLIDRAGLVAWEGRFPKPEADPDRIVSRLLSGAEVADR
ncbi:MAG: redoxin domain-containing protein [Planctomycetaceae bacterium]